MFNKLWHQMKKTSSIFKNYSMLRCGICFRMAEKIWSTIYAVSEVYAMLAYLAKIPYHQITEMLRICKKSSYKNILIWSGHTQTIVYLNLVLNTGLEKGDFSAIKKGGSIGFGSTLLSCDLNRISKHSMDISTVVLNLSICIF